MADAVKPATLPEDVILDLKVKFPISVLQTLTFPWSIKGGQNVAFPVTLIGPWIEAENMDLQGVGNDSYVSAFAGYHAVWYTDFSPRCKAGWHTHVSLSINETDATQAMKLQLGDLIAWLDKNM